MKNQCLSLCSLVALLAATTGAAATEPALRVRMIDDFTSGPFSQVMPSMPAGWGTYYEDADVIGDVRQTNLISDDTLGASSRIDIGPERLEVSSGIGSYFGAFLAYGYDAAGNDGDMHENFAGYDYFQIDFERSDLGLVYLVEVIDGNGVLAQLAGTLTTEAQSTPYSAELALTEFRGGDAAGNPQPIDWSDIRYVIVLFQSGNASGGNDFSVTAIRAVDAAEEP